MLVDGDESSEMLLDDRQHSANIKALYLTQTQCIALYALYTKCVRKQ